MIKLLDVLGIDTVEKMCDYKVHFATGSGDKMRPYNAFLTGDFKEWQEAQTQRNFSRKYVLSLIYYKPNYWLFGGVYKILPTPLVEIHNGNWTGWKYDTELVDIQTDLIGRAVIYYKKDYRASYPRLEMVVSNEEGMSPRDMYISEMFDKQVSIEDFPGFDKVNIDYATLQMIVDGQLHTWKSVLSNVKGIYLIVDKKTGKQYVGSAYGDECFWQRWSAYAKDGCGGNVELSSLIKKHGADYRYNFKYSILEICNMNIGNEYIIERENYWKQVLLTREFGLNQN